MSKRTGNIEWRQDPEDIAYEGIISIAMESYAMLSNNVT